MARPKQKAMIPNLYCRDCGKPISNIAYASKNKRAYLCEGCNDSEMASHAAEMSEMQETNRSKRAARGDMVVHKGKKWGMAMS